MNQGSELSTVNSCVQCNPPNLSAIKPEGHLKFHVGTWHYATSFSTCEWHSQLYQGEETGKDRPKDNLLYMKLHLPSAEWKIMISRSLTHSVFLESKGQPFSNCWNWVGEKCIEQTTKQPKNTDVLPCTSWVSSNLANQHAWMMSDVCEPPRPVHHGTSRGSSNLTNKTLGFQDHVKNM